MKNLRFVSLFGWIALVMSFSPPSHAWEVVCRFEGGGLGKVNYLDIRLYRRHRGNGRWDYKIHFPVSISPRCPPFQHAKGKVSAKFYMTKNESFDLGTFNLHSNATEVQKTFEDRNYYECIDAEHSWEHECKL